MSVIGLDLDFDSLVLYRGRDFKWTFENVDKYGNSLPYPSGRLFFELQTRGEHNGVQSVRVSGATGGTYKLGDGTGWTADIDYNDVSENPQGLAGDITDALEGLYGAGNVLVHPVSLYPSWTLNFNLNSGKPLTEQLVNIINKTANDFFDTFDGLFGVDVQMTVTDALNFKLRVTSLRSFSEVGVLTFAVDVTSAAVRDFFNAAAGLIGAVNTVSVDFYWDRTYEVEFTGELAHTEVAQMVVDATGLAGSNKALSVDIIAPGKGPVTIWEFALTDEIAYLKVEHDEVNKIHRRTRWQLVFLPLGEEAGGDPIAHGRVQVYE